MCGGGFRGAKRNEGFSLNRICFFFHCLEEFWQKYRPFPALQDVIYVSFCLNSLTTVDGRHPVIIAWNVHKTLSWESKGIYPQSHQPSRNKSLLKGYLTTMILYNNPLIEALFLGGGQVALGLTLDFHEPWLRSQTKTEELWKDATLAKRRMLFFLNVPPVRSTEKPCFLKGDWGQRWVEHNMFDF